MHGSAPSSTDRKVTFYDPHPGVGGAAIPLPALVKRIADALDGQTLPLGAAVACLQAVTAGRVEAVEDRGWIKLTLGDTPPMHIWRVLRFR